MRRAFGLLLLLSLLGCSPPSEKETPKQAASPPAGTAPKVEPAKPAAPAAAAPTPTFTSTVPDQLASLTVADGGKCSIDSINRNADPKGWTVRRGEVISVGGWVLDIGTKTTSDWAVVRLDAADGVTRFYFPTTSRGERPDLFQAFGSGPGVSKATFTFSAATDRLPPGTYKLTVLHQSAAGGQACKVDRTLSVTE